MSWWICLENDAGQTVEVERFQEGGTQVLGGSTEAEINVTYNYGKHFDFKSLNHLSAKDTNELIANKVLELGTQRDLDYWKPTPGNVGYTLSILLKWGLQHPYAVWRVS